MIDVSALVNALKKHITDSVRCTLAAERNVVSDEKLGVLADAAKESGGKLDSAIEEFNASVTREINEEAARVRG